MSQAGEMVRFGLARGGIGIAVGDTSYEETGSVEMGRGGGLVTYVYTLCCSGLWSGGRE